MTARQSVIDRFLVDLARDIDDDEAHMANIDLAAERINASADRANMAIDALYPVRRDRLTPSVLWATIIGTAVLLAAFWGGVVVALERFGVLS